MSKFIHISEPSFLGNEARYINEVIEAKSLSMGKYVQRFEQLCADMMFARYAVATSSGTTALHAALLALGVKQGDRVVVPACSYIATANAVNYCGAIPVFVDVLPETWVIDPEVAKEAAYHSKAVGIITVNLYGVIPKKFTSDNKFWVLEDACESHGSRLKADIAVSSFYGNKIITCGEGGAIVTNREDLYLKCRLLRGQGTTETKKYYHETLGYNYRMTEMQAAIGCAQLENLHDHLSRRAHLRWLYALRLTQKVSLQVQTPGASNWLVPILIPNRDIVANDLLTAGIETRPIFPPLNRQPIYFSDRHFPIAERIAHDGLLLPLHLGMTEDDVHFVCDTLIKSLNKNIEKAS